MSEFFRQFSDDQLALMLCGLAILGSWCLLQISYYVGRSTTAVSKPMQKPLKTQVVSPQEKAA